MSDLQTYKGANWVDVKDSDELVIYDTSKPTYIREAEPDKYKLKNRVWSEGGEGAVLGFWTFFSNDPDLYNTISLELDQDTEAPSIKVVVGEFYSIEDEDACALWREVREALDAEAVKKLFGEWEDGSTGTLIPEFMTLAQALYDNPTEANAEALFDYLEAKASDESEDPSIIVWDEPAS